MDPRLGCNAYPGDGAVRARMARSRHSSRTEHHRDSGSVLDGRDLDLLRRGVSVVRGFRLSLRTRSRTPVLALLAIHSNESSLKALRGKNEMAEFRVCS